jgi:hypothetical protein
LYYENVGILYTKDNCSGKVHEPLLQEFQMARSHEADLASFNARIVETSGCHFWSGGTVGGSQSNNGGYGVAVFDGKTQLAHRICYTLAKGPIPVGLVIGAGLVQITSVRPTTLK